MGEIAALSTNYIAWLSSTAVNAIDRLADAGAGGPWVTTIGRLVAADGPDLVDGVLSHPIVFDEKSVFSKTIVWTGTLDDGVKGHRCADWSSTDSTGLVGLSSQGTAAAGTGWSGVAGHFAQCGLPSALYCFQP